MIIHIIVPAHNEAENLAYTVKSLRLLYPQSTITIATDGNTDDTDKVAHHLTMLGNVFVKSSPTRLGKGLAIKQALLPGITNAYFDADCAVHPYALEAMYKMLLEKGGVIAAKRVPLKRSFTRGTASKIYNQLIRVLFHTGISDHQCGCKLLSPEAVEVFKQVKNDGFLFDTELILRCKRAGLAVTEYPVSWVEYKKQSTVNLWRDGTKMLLGVIKLWLTS